MNADNTPDVTCGHIVLGGLYRSVLLVADNTQLDSLSEKVLGAVFEASNTLGAGFLEKVYQRALLRELGLRGMRATAEVSLAVMYKGCSVGEYFADVLVEDALVVELKGAERLASHHTSPMSQLSACLWPHRVSAGQFSEAQSRVAANRVWICRRASDTAGNPG
jgi:GxxExxY protein